MTQEQKILIDGLCVAVTGTPRQLEPQVDWQAVLRLAKKHSVAALLCDGLQKSGIWEQVPESVQSALNGAYMHAIFRDAQLEFVRQQLSEKLQEAKIPHIYLKGAVLKYNYPVPALRTMSDMDVLIREEDFDALDRVVKSMDAEQQFGDGNHKNYTFPGGVLIEFHPNFLHHASRISTLINPGWQYAEPIDGSSEWKLTEEGFYLFNLCHLADHFTGGGMGVRFLLDVWVNRNLRMPQPDRQQVEAELERFSLLEFACNIERLSEAWFGDDETSALVEELGDYILNNGIFGNLSQSALNEVSLAGNRRNALMRRVFYPRAEMESRYPWCKGKPYLLPAAWFARVFTAVRLHSSHIRTWSKGAGELTNEEIAARKEQMRRFGITGKT